MLRCSYVVNSISLVFGVPMVFICGYPRSSTSRCAANGCIVVGAAAILSANTPAGVCGYEVHAYIDTSTDEYTYIDTSVVYFYVYVSTSTYLSV